MPRFQYKAASSAGEVIEGVMEARSREAVMRRLQADGHVPIRADEVSAVGRTARRLGPWTRRRVGADEVAVFTEQLASLLEAGLTLDRALELLSDLAEREPVREMVSGLRSEVRGGAELSRAMERVPGVFSGFYVSMVRAGESAGAMTAALGRLAAFLERSRALRESVVSALVYPMILLTLAGASLAVLLTFVVPRFARLFEDAGQALPASTQFVIGAAGLLTDYGWIAAIAVAAGVWLWRSRMRDPGARLAWDTRTLGWPLVGELITKVETARFSQTLASLLENGVPMLAALAIAREVLGNRAMAASVDRAADEVRAGRGLAAPIQDGGVFPALVGQMLQVGEETGSLERMLARLAEIYERDVQRTVTRLLALLEPALILVLGIVVAGVILSILSAVLGMNELAI